MNSVLFSLGFVLLGYLLGSLPFCVWITKIATGTDVRDFGSGHATASNVVRRAGWFPGLIAFGLDVTKGFLPTFLAMQYGEGVWVVPLTAAMAVVGHNWPVWAGFRGGMGLATTGGVFLAVHPFGLLAGVILLIVLLLFTRRWAHSIFYCSLLITPLALFLGLDIQVVWQTVLISAVLTIRFISGWKQGYGNLLRLGKKEASTE